MWTDYAGESIMRGTIYVLGQVKSLGKKTVLKHTTLDDQNELEIINKIWL